MRRIAGLLLIASILLPSPGAAQSGAGRLVNLDDLVALKEVSDPQISPEGDWVAYTVSEADVARDEFASDLWMTAWDGNTTVRLTSTPKESEHTPRWSPDGRWLAFLSSRGGNEDADQLWLMNRLGGEAVKVTEMKAGVSDYAWSPDGTRIALVIEDGDSVEVTGVFSRADAQPDSAGWLRPTGDSGAGNVEPPILIDRFYFKEDYTGYVRRKRKHLYLFTVADRKLEQLTSGDHDERLPAWAPDGRSLAFTSKRAGTDPDRHSNWDLFVMEAASGAAARQLTTFTGPDAHPDWESRPAWSPDGRSIAYLQGGPDSLIYYALPRLAVIAADPRSGPTLLTQALDRQVTRPAWSPDGKSIYFRLEEDRAIHLARVAAVGGGPVTRVVEGRQAVEDFSIGKDDRIAVLVETPGRPPEIFAWSPTGLRALSHQNDSLLAQVRLAPVEEISTKSRDGTVVNGFLVRPTDYRPGTRYPTILSIHGGPVDAFQNDFNFYWQLLAANGYAVVGMNPRGSSGRGEKYALAIWADWGRKDAQDVLAGVDYAVKIGVANPERLGVGGWSYGAMLTNYVIAQDTRFRGATSGAGISNILAGYGTDQYVREYEAELGPPWKNTATWLRVSFPFLHADRIRTPTLFLCGAKDFNVPLLNSEQMYQALRSLGVPTGLVIYPDTYHGIAKPSYQRHRLSQYLSWYGEFVRSPTASGN
jgi:dipeptidyl aminopeptidase/acylaminoacyl peptidase